MHAKCTSVFFAVGHPILQPILWISDVLHGSPGPMVGDLVPLSFILGNVAFIGLTAFSKQVSNYLYFARRTSTSSVAHSVFFLSPQVSGSFEHLCIVGIPQLCRGWA